MPAPQWQIGHAKITAIIENNDWRAHEMIQETVKGWTPELVETERPWIAPYVTEDNKLKAAVTAFVIEVGGKRFLIDTCIGSHKELHPVIDPTRRWSGHQTRFFETLTEADYPPEGIDKVVCTHLHSDHTGNNTRFVDGKWVPAFPNAEYLFPRGDYDAFEPIVRQPGRDFAAWGQNIEPILVAGKYKLTDGNESLYSKGQTRIFLMPTPGHTPGHASIGIEIDGKLVGIVIGDAFHHPIQVPHPELGAGPSDWTPAAAETSRRKIIELGAKTGVVIFSAHACEPADRVIRNGKKLEMHPVAPA